MKKPIELNPKQMQALQFALANNGRASVLTLHRHMQCDRVTAKSIISQLVELEFLTLLANGQYMLSSDGRDYLIMKKVPGAERKATGSAAHRKSSTVRLVDEKKMAELDAMISAPQVEEQPVESAPAVVLEAPTGNWGKRPQFVEWSKGTEQTEFERLVRQGLEKLNMQLGMKPVIIENVTIKIEALEELSLTLRGFDSALSDLLGDVARDLCRVGCGQ